MNYIQAQSNTSDHTPTPSRTQSHNFPTAWGDHMTPLTQTEQKHTLRLAFQNTNGINTQHNWSAWTNACQFIKQSHISIFGAVETNLYWSTENKHKLQQYSMKHLTTPRTVTTSCNHHPSKSIYQPGGSLLLSAGRWTRRCHQVSVNPSGMGRWTHL